MEPPKLDTISMNIEHIVNDQETNYASLQSPTDWLVVSFENIIK